MNNDFYVDDETPEQRDRAWRSGEPVLLVMPGLYCCLNPECAGEHPRGMIFNGGAGYDQ